MKKFYDVLKILELLEDTLANLYETLSQKFADDKKLSALFYRLNIDEISHRDLVKYQMRLLKKSESEDFADIEIDISEIEELLDKAKEAILSLDGIDPPKAIELAMEIESSAAERHYNSAIRQSNPKLAKLLHSLGEGDKHHLQRLHNYIKSSEFEIQS